MTYSTNTSYAFDEIDKASKLIDGYDAQLQAGVNAWPAAMSAIVHALIGLAHSLDSIQRDIDLMSTR